MIFADGSSQHHTDHVSRKHCFTSSPHSQSTHRKEEKENVLGFKLGYASPYFRKNHGVRKGRMMKTATETTIKISVLMVNGEKISPAQSRFQGH